MQKINVLLCLSALLECSILFSASSEKSLTAFERCENAVEAGDFVAFQRSISRDLLLEYKLRTFPDEPSRAVPVTIAHLVVTKKHENTRKMIDYMVELGFNPNETWSVLVQDEPQSLSGQRSEDRQSPLPLDLAVLYASMPAVKGLLANGAGAYNTSKRNWLKRFFSRRCGENPLTLVDAYIRRVIDGDLLPGTVDEYQAIANLLEQAQQHEDIEECSVQ